MSNAEDGDTQLRSQELDDLVASTDTGGRTPDSRFVMMLLSGLALAWAVWQVWIASPVSYQIGWGVFSSKEARPFIWHLRFSWPIWLIPQRSGRPGMSCRSSTGC